MHVEDKPAVPSSIRPDIPPELDELILWALEKESTNRPPSAAEMRERLLVIKSQLAPTGQFTPPPITSSGQRPIALTPPPSGRNKVVGSTPAPRSGSLPPVGSRSGGQAPISTRTKLQPQAPVAGSNETRLQPLTAMTGVAPAEPARVEAPENFTDPEVPVVPKSKLPVVLAGVVGVLLLAVVVFFAVGPTSQTDHPPVVVDPPVKVEPPPVVKVEPPPIVKVDPDPPKVDPIAKVDPPKVDPVAKVDAPKPKARVITTEQLVSRLRKIEAQLAAKEAETGQKDNVLRQFVEQARKEIQKATNDADRKAAWGFLGDIEAQLKR